MDLITVGSFPNSAEAALAKNLLDAEGIPAFVGEDATGDLFHLASPFGEAKVQVSTEYAERARAILDAAQRHEFEAETEKEGDAVAEATGEAPADPNAAP
jgi:hypothetical protein